MLINCGEGGGISLFSSHEWTYSFKQFQDSARARAETAVLLVLKLIIKYNLDLNSLIKLIDYFIKYEGI